MVSCQLLDEGWVECWRGAVLLDVLGLGSTAPHLKRLHVCLALVKVSEAYHCRELCKTHECIRCSRAWRQTHLIAMPLNVSQIQTEAL